MTTVAIIPAAGSGKRFGSSQKKIFAPLGGKPLIVYALKALNSSGYIDTIIIAVQTCAIERLKRIIKKYGISKVRFVTSGGKTRAESVKNCFASLFEARAIYYRVVQKSDHLKVGLAAVVQEMIQSETAGVMFTVEPAGMSVTAAVSQNEMAGLVR